MIVSIGPGQGRPLVGPCEGSRVYPKAELGAFAAILMNVPIRILPECLTALSGVTIIVPIGLGQCRPLVGPREGSRVYPQGN